MKLLRALCLLLLATCVLWPREALAEEPRDDPRARQFFEFGAQAYKQGQYLLAIDAFEQAYALTERPGLLFSLAQAHQRQFRMSGDAQHLAQAIDVCRKYLARVESGGRRSDVQSALNALLATADRLQAKDQVGHGQRVFGRLLLSSSTPNAVLTVNGEAVESLPTALELPAEKYRVVATAKGFEPRVQEIALTAGSTVPLNLELEPLPAWLAVAGPANAEVLVDGRSVGWLPLGRVSLTEGDHWVSLRKSGYRTRSVLARLERGQTVKVRLSLETTFQRDAARLIAGAGVATGVASVTLGILSWRHDASAKELAKRFQGQASEADADQLARDVAARDRFRTLALVGGVTTAALLGTSLLLYLSDAPAPPTTSETVQSAARSPRWLVAPWAGPAWGIATQVRF
jgi:hypothetical protein